MNESASELLAELSYSAGPPTVSGRIRVALEDFQVVEELGFVLEGAGEHVFVYVRKQGVNTDWVARQIARCADVPPKAVGYAGLKDRHAVAEQWFSVHLPGKSEPDWTGCGGAEFSVLKHIRHSRKLKRGALKGNQFNIVIRDFDGPPVDLKRRVAQLAGQGVPNYFGEQRFGLGGGNLAQAEALFRGELRVKDRYRRGLYLSAARALLFNQVLSKRLAEGNWDQALAGDMMMLDGSHSVFHIDEVDAEIRRRIGACDIHPSGPLWGAGKPPVTAAALAVEQAVAGRYPLFCQGLVAAGLRQERRALRVCVTGLRLAWLDHNTPVLSLRLPAGAYATAVLRELLRYTVG